MTREMTKWWNYEETLTVYLKYEQTLRWGWWRWHSRELCVLHPWAWGETYDDGDDDDDDDDDVDDDDDGLPAYSHQSYSHQVGLCHYDEGWENDTVTFTMYKSVIYT